MTVMACITEHAVDPDSGVFVTASDLLEYLFCPRFIYFMYCLGISQHEDQRYKVVKGRTVHEGRERTNIEYLRKRISCVTKEIDVYLSSPKYHIKGIVDEVLTLSDGTMAPLDYKFAEFHEKVFKTYRFQSVFYGLLIQENYRREVNCGFVCYTRSNNLLKELRIGQADFDELQQMVSEMLDIIQKGYYPRGTDSPAKCIDCCYRRICV
jgi:CRISPR-associated exonuclease Cas4